MPTAEAFQVNEDYWTSGAYNRDDPYYALTIWPLGSGTELGVDPKDYRDVMTIVEGNRLNAGLRVGITLSPIGFWLGVTSSFATRAVDRGHDVLLKVLERRGSFSARFIDGLKQDRNLNRSLAEIVDFAALLRDSTKVSFESRVGISGLWRPSAAGSRDFWGRERVLGDTSQLFGKVRVFWSNDRAGFGLSTVSKTVETPTATWSYLRERTWSGPRPEVGGIAGRFLDDFVVTPAVNAWRPPSERVDHGSEPWASWPLVDREGADQGWPKHALGQILNGIGGGFHLGERSNWIGANRSGGIFSHAKDTEGRFPLGLTTVVATSRWDQIAKRHDIQDWVNWHAESGTEVQVPIGPGRFEYFVSRGRDSSEHDWLATAYVLDPTVAIITTSWPATSNPVPLSSLLDIQEAAGTPTISPSSTQGTPFELTTISIVASQLDDLRRPKKKPDDPSPFVPPRRPPPPPPPANRAGDTGGVTMRLVFTPGGFVVVGNERVLSGVAGSRPSPRTLLWRSSPPPNPK